MGGDYLLLLIKKGRGNNVLPSRPTIYIRAYANSTCSSGIIWLLLQCSVFGLWSYEPAITMRKKITKLE